jgi:hypothetical protein
MQGLTFVLRAASIALCGALIATSSLGAQEVTIESMVVMTGTCKKLTVSGKNRTADCKGKLLNTGYSDGRTGFYFVTTDGFTITFSTRGDQQVHPDANTAIAPVDMVIVGGRGNVDRIAAVGRCKFTNPYRGPAPLECRAETAGGIFDASFISDGSKPEKAF